MLETCEQHVAETWKKDEIILEVEDYNDQGLEFYRKRGYEVLFSDPTSRRYDIQGFWLNKVRCRRDIMRKALERTGTGGKVFQGVARFEIRWAAPSEHKKRVILMRCTTDFVVKI